MLKNGRPFSFPLAKAVHVRFIFIANNILIVMTSLSSLFGWHDKLSLIMAVGYIIAAIANICFLTKHNKETKNWDVSFIVI